ncbi:DNA methyltransferase [uncultured Victivallis sp.]|uniref:DNA methyltransferase n=1 Tax=uncultured Victivallis sp. TaxID=354118 RepID=UPI00258BFA2F|nr:DNA methyltransferase [uncultured Victivallis sp.]
MTENIPEYEENFIVNENPNSVFQKLQSLDWAFTDEDTGFLTHDIHPYPAKFIPQIPGNMIARLSCFGDIVFDPFGGSGTTALEAIRLGRRAISVDANPVATLIGRVKTIKLTKNMNAELNGFHALIESNMLGELIIPEVLVQKYANFIPDIPNREKWFPDTSCGELALIRSSIAGLNSEEVKSIALLALSRIILNVSFQDSETRYKSSPKEIPAGKTLLLYIKELENIRESINKVKPNYGSAEFITGDIRYLDNAIIANNAVDLVVTSPPYGNAHDYHLYHRFRLLWIGCDPKILASIEIGSHLKHQREGSGFESYLQDMKAALTTIERVLKPNRYAVLVIGDSIYDGIYYDSAKEIKDTAITMGFDSACIIERTIHKTKRSFSPVARRANIEKILVIRKKPNNISIGLEPPPYKLYPYEKELRKREIESLLGIAVDSKNAIEKEIVSTISGANYHLCRNLTFSHNIKIKDGANEPTWQAVLERGMASNLTARKDPKYVTHGIHPYKGKFYPQLAKCLINLQKPNPGALIVDPFCGSGTTILEGFLNGLQGIGFDMNPLAVLIAKAKLGILTIPPDIVRESYRSILELLDDAPITPSGEITVFPAECMEEIEKWFPPPVIHKINWVIQKINGISTGIIQDFFKVILSSIVRTVSQQDPSDLRIRYRKERIQDADVYKLFREALETQYCRVEKFWNVKGYSPHRFVAARIVEADSRVNNSWEKEGLSESSVDLVVTSPPYATALPYIDTDRLSILTILNLSSAKRRPIEYNLIGSREITNGDRKEILNSLSGEAKLPVSISNFILDLANLVQSNDSGFRKQNMPSLLIRFFDDMQKVLQNMFRALKSNSYAILVIGDNTMQIKGEKILIPTTDFIAQLATSIGFVESERLDISVTTENLIHINNAITKNIIIFLKKP